MAQAATKSTASAPRKASRDTRRNQLIEATIATLGERGYARTTLSDVAIRAGLSHGLVNFHFKSKENLLSETLIYLAEEYRLNWRSAVAEAGDDPAAQLEAMVTADFKANLCTRERVSSWAAFWGEAQSRPLYQQHCGNNDLIYMAFMQELCAKLLDRLGRSDDAERVARVIRTCSDGVWLEMVNMTTPYKIEEGRRTVLTCMAAFFPEYYTPEGLITR